MKIVFVECIDKQFYVPCEIFPAEESINFSPFFIMNLWIRKFFPIKFYCRGSQVLREKRDQKYWEQAFKATHNPLASFSSDAEAY